MKDMNEQEKKYRRIIAAIGLVCAISIVFNVLKCFPQKDEKGAVYQQSQRQEEYIFMPPFMNDPLINEQDMKGLERFAEEKGVKVTVMAPEKFDAVETAKMFEKAIEKKPAGIMVCATDTILISCINKAIEKGIPVVTVDADRPESKRLAYIGSNWNEIGVKQAEAIVRLTSGKGIVAGFGIAGNINMTDAWDGFQSVLNEYEDISVLGMFDDVSNRDEAKRIMLDLLEEYPEIVAVAGFDSNSAFGICKALEEKNKINDVAVVSVDMTKEHIDLLKKGYVKRLVGQKRELFAYYGGMLLYDYNHEKINIINQDIDSSIIGIPERVDTGIVILDEDDIK